MAITTLKEVYLRCPECSAEHCRPERVDLDDPPETIEKKCIPPHPARGNIFNGCGEVVELEVIRVEEK